MIIQESMTASGRFFLPQELTMSRETGGYAFPIPNADFQTFLPSTVDEYKRIQSGMTLRDYFAAKAMQGRLANPDWLASD